MSGMVQEVCRYSVVMVPRRVRNVAQSTLTSCNIHFQIAAVI